MIMKNEIDHTVPGLIRLLSNPHTAYFADPCGRRDLLDSSSEKRRFTCPVPLDQLVGQTLGWDLTRETQSAKAAGSRKEGPGGCSCSRLWHSQCSEPRASLSTAPWQCVWGAPWGCSQALPEGARQSMRWCSRPRHGAGLSRDLGLVWNWCLLPSEGLKMGFLITW